MRTQQEGVPPGFEAKGSIEGSPTEAGEGFSLVLPSVRGIALAAKLGGFGRLRRA